MNYYNKYKDYNDGCIHTFIINERVYIDTFNNIFKPLYLFKNKSRYIIDICGNVYNIKKKNNKKMVNQLSSGGYYRVCLTYANHKYKTFSVHRLVASTFIPNVDNKPDVNHLDGDKSHNYAENLEWCTKSENMIHAYKNNLNSNKGENNPKSKLTEKDVEEIRILIKTGNISLVEIGKMYHVSKATISHIKTGDTWNDKFKKEVI